MKREKDDQDDPSKQSNSRKLELMKSFVRYRPTTALKMKQTYHPSE